MADVPDLAPFSEFLPGEWSNVLAIGWGPIDHVEAPVDQELVRLLTSGEDWPDTENIVRQCSACAARGITRQMSGVVIVPSDDVAFVAPALITHSIARHGYRPPDAFIEAVRRQPPARTDSYRAAVSRFITRPAPLAPLPAIHVLEGLRSTRVRPGMYFGGIDQRALEQMLFEVHGNSIDQYLAGENTRIAIEVGPDGWVCVEDEGAGIPVTPLEPGLSSLLEVAFTRLSSNPTLDGHFPHVHLRQRLHGVGLGAVSALSVRVEVDSFRLGEHWRAVFSCGSVLEPPRSLGPTSRRGTRIRYLRDEDVFGDARLDLDHLRTALAEHVWLSPGLELTLNGKPVGQPTGLRGWLHELAPDVEPTSVIAGTKTVDDVRVDVAFGWSPSVPGQRLRSFVNYHPTVEHGSHAAGLLDAIESKLRSRSTTQGLVAVVHVGLLHPRFRGPVRQHLQNPEAVTATRAAVEQLIDEHLAGFPAH